MDIYEFAVNFPQMYQRIDEEVQQAVAAYPVHSWALQDWDNFVDQIVNKYDQDDAFWNESDEMMSQQFDFGDRDRDRDRDDHRRRRRRRRRDFDLRDLTRIIFLRRLFDRNRF